VRLTLSLLLCRLEVAEGSDQGPFDMYDGTYFAGTKPMIVVTANYRLGALGFLVVNDIGGNFGLLDQQFALQWVQTNIGETTTTASLRFVPLERLCAVALSLLMLLLVLLLVLWPAAFGGDPNRVTIWGESGTLAILDTVS
jgi:hypothetical protein